MSSSPAVLLDTSAWWFLLARKRRLDADQKRVSRLAWGLYESGAAWVHPTAAGELFLGGVDTGSQFFQQAPWLSTTGETIADQIAWARTVPRERFHKVGWADCQIVYSAVLNGMPLLTGDRRQEALLLTARGESFR